MASANMATISNLTTTTTIGTTTDQTMQSTTAETTISPLVAEFTTILMMEDNPTEVTTIEQCYNSTSCPAIAVTETNSRTTDKLNESKNASTEQNENETAQLQETTTTEAIQLNGDNYGLSTEQTIIATTNIHGIHENGHNEEIVNEVSNTHHNDLPNMESSNDINNEILTVIEEKPEIKLFPSDNTDPTENLEESIRNSVKNEIEMEQRLDSSPVLDILKEIPEPEIREILREDLSINPSILEQHDAAISSRFDNHANKKSW